MTLSSSLGSQFNDRRFDNEHFSTRYGEAEAALEQHDLAALFVQHLKWEPCTERCIALTPLLQAQTRCSPIARKASAASSTVIWEVQVATDTLLTSSLKEQIYSDIAEIEAKSSARRSSADTVCGSTVFTPLVVFVNSKEHRSLWCQASDSQKQKSPSIHSVLYISGQPLLFWSFRLARLKEDGQGLLRSNTTESYPLLKSLLARLCKGITGISNITDRQDYALLTLQRLVLIQAVQQKGWIDSDTWYLQTRFEKTTQAQNNFFEACVRPLYQCLALPRVERPATLSEQVGAVPFLGSWFHTHAIEQKYLSLSIQNQPFEEILAWLSEQTSADGFNLWTTGSLSACLESLVKQQEVKPEEVKQKEETQKEKTQRKEKQKEKKRREKRQERKTREKATLPVAIAAAKTVCDRTLNQLLVNRTQAVTNGDNFSNINDLLFNADTAAYRYLIQDVLPSLRILDPACGSGNLLIGMYQRIIEIVCNLIGCVRQNQDAQMNIWLSGLAEESSFEQDRRSGANLLQAIQQRVLKNNLYGVDISKRAVETTIFQLLLHTVRTAIESQDIEPLVDLTFNVLEGNSLIGLIDVDEQRFEQVQSAGDRQILQGNLLQPLVADSYQTVLTEKNLALEHYKFRNRMLADARNIPDYARSALLKEEISKLDANAQQKLDRLLLNQMSQQLGIQYKAAQLDGKPQRRPLAPEDIDILTPFHWGYHFNTVLAKGGFDIVVCAPPQTAFKPTATEFLQKFRDLAEAKGIDERSLKTSKQALAKGDLEVAEAWLFYQNQYAYVADYFYRSEQYAHQTQKIEGKATRSQLSRERLFIERCFHLLSKKGTCALVLSSSLAEQPKAQSLYNFLQEQASVVEQDVNCSPQELSQDKGTIIVITKTLIAVRTSP